MRVLVDGHNALFALRLRGGDHAALRRALALRVAEVDRKATVFFDAKRAPPGARVQGSEGGARVVYCRGRDADEEILDRVRGAARPGSVLVVTDDRELRGRAAQLGAKVCKVEEFFSRRARPEGKPERGAGGFTPADFGLPDVVDLDDPEA
jgi:hypothetical protein